MPASPINGKLPLSSMVYISLIALSTLFYELSLIRILDILWYPHFAYMVITLALLGFGIAGVVTSIIADKRSLGGKTLVLLTLLLAISYAGLFFFLNRFHVDFNNFRSVAYLGAKVILVFSGIVVPFFLSGLILSLMFTENASQFGKLYFWDLIGASLGCLLVPLLIPTFGGPGLLFVASGMALFGVVLISRSRVVVTLALLAAIGVSGFQLFLNKDEYLEIAFHMDKRGFKTLQGGHILTRWDRISRIDLIQYRDAYVWIAYDGGSQTSYFYKFDGDYKKLRESLPEKAVSQFWDRFVLASHWLKEGTGAKVLVIGAAGGQETKAAVTFGASSVDAIEMVGSVIDLGKEKYATEPYNNPIVNAVRGEGRSFLRSSNKTYDIIQMMSNHTSASIASGSGAVSPNYLQTTDAYKEYYSHLSKNGVLHINHHIYPKMVLTAARAWKEMGRKDFEKHVLLYYTDRWYNLPTLLIKMEPWTQTEFDRVQALMGDGYTLIHNPLDPGKSGLAPEFFTGTLPDALLARIPYRMDVPTDDNPFFNHIRKRLQPVSYDEPYVDLSIKTLLNDSIKHGLPMDIIHLIVSAGAALLIAVVCLFGPLLFSKVGREQWEGKAAFVSYFACLGAGFIAIELVFIQLFYKLVGFPLYTYVSVVFAFLLSAGIGSYCTDIFKLHTRRWTRFLPFVAIPLYGFVLLMLKEPLLNYSLQWSTLLRIGVTVVLIAPLGFFLGMPFAMGIASSYAKGKGAVGWAWAVNGLFTVLGSVISIIVAIYIGFIPTLLGAFSIYILAGLLLPRFSKS
jgi:spermidine synthase